MSQLNNLPLYLQLYNLQKYLYLLTRNFPKAYKYTLGEDILNFGWRTLDAVIKANTLPNHLKAEEINSASALFDQLKTRLRMAHELRLVPHPKHAYLIGLNEEIGKMMSGWSSWAKNQPQNTRPF